MSLVARDVEAAAPDGGLQLDAFLPLRLSSAADLVSGLIARAYQDRFGLSICEWRVICLLAASDALTPERIALHSGMEAGAARHAAAALAARSLVRPTSAGLTLSQDGVRLHAEIAPLALAYEAALIAGLTPGEVAMLKRLLGRLQSAARSLAGEPAA